MKRKIFIGLLLFSMSLLAGPAVFAQEEDDDDQSGGLCENKYGATAEDSAKCVMNISLYREFYKQWKKEDYKNNIVKDAIRPWRWVFLNCPCGTQNTYIDGANILGKYLIENARTPKEKNAYIDTLMMLYDQRIQYFNNEGDILGRKGVDLYRFRTSDFEEAYNIFKRSVELEGNKSSGAVLVYYFRTAIKMATSGKMDSTVIVETYDQVSEIIDYNLENASSGSRPIWENIKGNVEVTFEPFATCEDLVAIYGKKFKETPDDIELLKKITEMLDKKKCNDTELFFEASIKLYDLEPSPVAAFMIGKMLINKKDYDKATQYLKEATALEDPEDKADAYYYMAFCYQMQKNHIKAREMARKAIEANPEKGSAYILIGDLYAASSNDCASDDIMKKAVYWIAVDYYYQAKKMDPSVAEMANDRINSYAKYFPTKEELFFHDLADGDSYTVTCWINEATTVRAAK